MRWMSSKSSWGFLRDRSHTRPPPTLMVRRRSAQGAAPPSPAGSVAATRRPRAGGGGRKEGKQVGGGKGRGREERLAAITTAADATSPLPAQPTWRPRLPSAQARGAIGRLALSVEGGRGKGVPGALGRRRAQAPAGGRSAPSRVVAAATIRRRLPACLRARGRLLGRGGAAKSELERGVGGFTHVSADKESQTHKSSGH